MIDQVGLGVENKAYRDSDFGLVRAKLLIRLPLHGPHELCAEIEVVLVESDWVRVKCFTFPAISEHSNCLQITVATCTRGQDNVLALKKAHTYEHKYF